MKTKPALSGLVAAAALVSLPAEGQAGLVRNPSFESNYNDAFPHYGPIDEWTGGSGVNEAAGPFHNGGTPLADGFRTAFGQGSQSLSQDISGLEPGKRYLIQFFYDARGCCGGTIDISVNVNGVELDKIANVRPATGGNPYHFRSVPFTAEADTATLALSTTAAGDATALFDGVTIVQRDEGQVTVMNSSFEASGDVIDTGLLSPAPLAGWTGTGLYGVNISGAGPFADNGAAADQDHVAFLQGAASLSQVLRNLTVGNSYEVTIAYNAKQGNTPHIRVSAGANVLFEEDVAAVGGAAAYRTRTATFTATDLTAEISIAQTKETEDTLLIDSVLVKGETQAPLPPLLLSPTVTELGPGQTQTVTVTVPPELLAIRAATLQFRSPNPAAATLAGADADGLVTLQFDKGGANTKSFDILAVGRGSSRIEIVENAGLTVVDDVTAIVVTSFVRNSSFESSAVPGGVGYGPIAAWTGGSGLNSSTGPFHDNGIVPDRRQIAFVQGAATLSQEIVGLAPGKNYWLQFFYNARAAGGTTIDLTVKFGGTQIAAVPAIAAVGEGAPYNFLNVEFVPQAARGLLEFTTVPSGDATLLLDGISIVQREPGEIVVKNPSFEASGSPSGVGYTQPDGLAGWDTPVGGRGINVNGAGPFSDNGISSDQDRVAFLQSTGATLSQTLTGLVAGQKHTLVYEVNTRNCCDATTPSTYFAAIDDVPVMDEEIIVAGAGSPYHLRYIVFTPAGEQVVLKFEHTSQGDHSLLLDNVRVLKGEHTAPEPVPALAVAGDGAGGIRISWPAAVAGFSVESANVVTGPWAAHGGNVTVEGNENVLSVSPAGTATYFRLAK